MNINLKPFYWSGFVCLLLALSIASCKKNEATNPGNTTTATPVIETVLPNRGLAGDTIAITGANFSANAADNFVLFNGTKAAVLSATATKLLVIAPQGGTTGNIEIQVKNSQVVVAGIFTYTQAISITSITPLKAQVGESVIITGANFREHRDDNTVLFNGIKAVLTSSSATRITATVPQGAASGKIQVVVDKQVATNTDFTLVSYPTTLAWQEVAIPAEMSEKVTSVAKGNVITFFNTTAGLYTDYGQYLFRLVNGQVTNVNPTLSSLYTLVISPNYFIRYDYAGISRSSDGFTWAQTPYQYARLSKNIFFTNNKLISYSYGKRYISTDEGSSWTENSDPLYDLLKDHYDYAIENGNNATIRYNNDVDNNIQYAIVKLSNGGQTLFRSTGTDTWERSGGNTNEIFGQNGYIDFVAAGGNNVFAVYSNTTMGRSVYKSLDKGDNWLKLNTDRVNVLKKCGEFIVYGADDFNLSFNKGHSFLKYPIPAGYIIYSIEMAEKTIYIFCKNSSGVIKLFKAQL